MRYSRPIESNQIPDIPCQRKNNQVAAHLFVVGLNPGFVYKRRGSGGFRGFHEEPQEWTAFLFEVSTRSPRVVRGFHEEPHEEPQECSILSAYAGRQERKHRRVFRKSKFSFDQI